MGRKVTMTSQQEAEYAYAYGAPHGLSAEARAIYDRLVAEDAAREPRSVADSEAENRQVTEDGRRAIADGRRVFLCRVPMGYDKLLAVGTSGLPGPSSVIEAIENLGWRLDMMSWVPRQGFRAEGIFLFRRAPE